jgi:hypothetical protein
VEDPAEVVRRGLSPKIRPQQVHHLLSVNAMTWRDGKKLDQAGCLPEPPLILFYGLRPYRNPEAPEQPNAYRLRCRVLAGSRRTIQALCSPRRHLPSCSATASPYRARSPGLCSLPPYSGVAPIVGLDTLRTFWLHHTSSITVPHHSNGRSPGAEDSLCTFL